MQELQALWENIVSILTEKFSAVTTKLWFGDASLESLDDDIAVISHVSPLKKTDH